MRRLGVWPLLGVLAALVLWGCQPDEPRRQGAGGDAPPRAGSGSGAEEEDEASPVPAHYRIFDEVLEEDDPPRVTLHLLLDARATRGELRATFQEALRGYADEHPEVVAVRGVGYLGAPRERSGGRQVDLAPVAWAEWLPPDGWHEATRESRDAIHRLYYYHGSPPPWQE